MRVIRELKDPEKRTIPIAAMTANAFDEDKKRRSPSAWTALSPNQCFFQRVAILDELLGKQ